MILEQRVANRTEELARVNEGLRMEIVERRQVEEALKESEVRYRAVTQSANEAIISSNSAGNIISWNRGAETIFGYIETEVIGSPLALLTSSNSIVAHLAGMARVQAGGEKHFIGKTVEVKGQHKNGSEIPLEISLSDWKINNDQFYTAIMRDVTVRKQVEEALRESEEKFQESLSGTCK